MKIADALKGLVTIGIKLTVPGGELVATALEKGSDLVIDEVVARRETDVAGRVFKALRHSFEKFAVSERLNEAEALNTVELARSVIAGYGIRPGEWSVVRFDAATAAVETVAVGNLCSQNQPQTKSPAWKQY
jgi:hypothetical protein